MMESNEENDFLLFNETLISISSQLLDTPTDSLATVMNTILEECRQVLGVDRISCLPDTEYISAEWYSFTVSGDDIPHLKPNLSFEVKSEYQRMIRSAKVLDSSDTPELFSLACKLQAQPPINHILIPIQAMGKPWGVFAAANFVTTKEFDTHFIRCATILGNIIASSIERLQHYQALSQQKVKVTALNKRLLEDGEKQLKIIARDLHDDFGQRLASLNLQLGLLNGQIDPPAQVALQSAAKDLSEITRDLQHLSRHLHPAIIDKVGLFAAIEAEAKKMTALKNIDLTLNLSNKALYQDNQKLHIYRICQEALSNVIRHSGATKLTLSLSIENNQASISFQDNGKGIQESALSRASSLGVQSMMERAELIGGHLRFNTDGFSHGCTVTLTWPIPDESAHHP